MLESIHFSEQLWNVNLGILVLIWPLEQDSRQSLHFSGVCVPGPDMIPKDSFFFISCEPHFWTFVISLN